MKEGIYDQYPTERSTRIIMTEAMELEKGKDKRKKTAILRNSSDDDDRM